MRESSDFGCGVWVCGLGSPGGAILGRRGKISSGAIVGIVTNAAKLPVAGATVTAARVGGGIRATVSGSDGVYSFADLPPGAWSLTVQVEGYPDVRCLRCKSSPAKRLAMTS